MLVNQYHVDLVPAQAGTSQRVGYGFDANKRTNVVYWGEIPAAFNITYNALGQYSQITSPNGQTRRFTHDDREGSPPSPIARPAKTRSPLLRTPMTMIRPVRARV